MVDRHTTPKVRSKSAPAKAPRPTSSRRRASQRAHGIEIELGYGGKLRPLMIEQSLTEEGEYITVYSGARGEFLAAGIPPHLIPAEGSVEFNIRRGDGCLRATMNSISVDRWELEIDWGREAPYSDGHPAICEIARMMLIDLGDWYRDPTSGSQQHKDLEQPIKKLLTYDQDFSPSKDAPRLQVSPEFRARLRELASYVYNQVLICGEVFPVPTTAQKVEPQFGPSGSKHDSPPCSWQRKGSPVRLVVSNNAEGVFPRGEQ